MREFRNEGEGPRRTREIERKECEQGKIGEVSGGKKARGKRNLEIDTDRQKKRMKNDRIVN